MKLCFTMPENVAFYREIKVKHSYTYVSNIVIAQILNERMNNHLSLMLIKRTDEIQHIIVVFKIQIYGPSRTLLEFQRRGTHALSVTWVSETLH